MAIGNLAGKIIYGCLFIFVLPALLLAWAHYSGHAIHLPVPGSKGIHSALVLSGATLALWGMTGLWFHGKGLPMNAYPPQQFVMRGAYAIHRHPIYLGTLLVVFGVAGLSESSSGFWLVAPAFACMTAAFVYGFENERIRAHFSSSTYYPFLSLPSSGPGSVNAREKAGVFFLTLIPWFVLYEAFVVIGVPYDAVYTNLSIENKIPVLESTVIFYSLIYVQAPLIPFILLEREQLRSFAFDTWLATGLAVLMYASIPFVFHQHPFLPATIWGELLAADRQLDSPAAAFPAFHVIWACLAAKYFSLRFRQTKMWWWMLSFLVSASCITTGNHGIVDVLGGIVVFLASTFRKQIWQACRTRAERIANSWHEWQWGPLRLINHGLYAGASAFVGSMIMGAALGDLAMWGWIIGVMAIIGAAFWAQFVEGSPKLQRPYGYYGSVVAALCASFLLATVIHIEPFHLLAAIALAAPWVQVIGRLRCLVQGCCHGKPGPHYLSICFTHPRSRVHTVSGLTGKPLHPTQLYSIATNLVIGLLLIRLVSLNMNGSFLLGIYLLLNSLGRFVEESLRGEAQTPYWLGMRVYQWMAIAGMALGAVFTCLPSAPLPPIQLTPTVWLGSIIIGVFSVAAYGLDFPRSSRRFARLTSN